MSSSIDSSKERPCVLILIRKCEIARSIGFRKITTIILGFQKQVVAICSGAFVKKRKLGVFSKKILLEVTLKLSVYSFWRAQVISLWGKFSGNPRSASHSFVESPRERVNQKSVLRLPGSLGCSDVHSEIPPRLWYRIFDHRQ